MTTELLKSAAIETLSEYAEMIESEAARIGGFDPAVQRLRRDVSGLRNLIWRLQRCPSTDLESLVLQGSANPIAGRVNHSLRVSFDSFSLDHAQLEPMAGALLAAVQMIASTAAARGDALPVVDLQVRSNSGFVRATVRCATLKSLDGLKVNALAQALGPVRGAVSVQAGDVPVITCEIPSSLRTLTGMVVIAAGQNYALPLCGVIEVVRLDHERVKLAGGREFLSLRSANLPLVSLAVALGKNESGANGKRYAVVVASGRGRFGLIVDQMAQPREMALQLTDGPVSGRPELLGGAIDSDGQVIEVIDPRYLRPGPVILRAQPEESSLQRKDPSLRSG